MNFDLTKLRNYFGMHKRETAAFMLLLLNMEKGEKFKSKLGEVVKLEDNLFKINTNMAVKELAEIWIDEIKNPLDNLFE